MLDKDYMKIKTYNCTWAYSTDLQCMFILIRRMYKNVAKNAW